MSQVPESRPSANPFVIAIGGPSGSGKSTLVNRVAGLLGDTVSLFFDDYASVSTYPSDFGIWLREGARPDDWKTPRFARDLLALRRGESVTSPGGVDRRDSARYIVVEEPFGRERSDMRPLVDLVAIIDLPLEIALIRVVRRAIQPGLDDGAASAECLRNLDQFLTFYAEQQLYQLYAAVNGPALATCDLVLDGLKSVDELAEQVVQVARARTQ